MSDPRVVFKHCGEALVRALKPKMTPELQAKLTKAGLDPSEGAALPPGFEFAKWLEILRVASEAVSPNDPKAGHHAIGEAITDAYMENFIGRALKPVITLIGMKRALGRMRQNFRVANNYSEAEAIELGPAHYELRVNETGLMGYFYRGILAKGLLLTSPKNLQVEIARQEAEWVVFSIRWDP